MIEREQKKIIQTISRHRIAETEQAPVFFVSSAGKAHDLPGEPNRLSYSSKRVAFHQLSCLEKLSARPLRIEYTESH